MRTNEMNATKQGGTMKELAFRYDIETDDWIECQSEMFVHEDIEKLPCAIYLDFKGVLVQTEKVLLDKGNGLFPWLHSDKGMPILPSGFRLLSQTMTIQSSTGIMMNITWRITKTKFT